MRDRLFRALLSVLLVFCCALPVFAQESAGPNLTLSTTEEFLQFAENCRLDSYSTGLTVALQADIDLEGTDFAGVPIFGGTLLGNGHTISGLQLTADGSAQGLFRYLTEGSVVQDLQVQGDLHPAGSRSQVGGIAGVNAGSIRNCSFEGTVSGSESIGGIAGVNAVTGIIENCQVSGELYGDHFVGGIAGHNSGVIRQCINTAAVNTTAQQNSVELSDITIDSLTGTEAANTVTDIGGIAGMSSGVIRGCENNGPVGYRHMGYNIGGIAGTQSGYIVDCRNHADVQGRKEVGGIVGQMEPVSQIDFSRDTLQILQTQLNTMTGLINRTSMNAQNNAGQISGQIGTLQSQAQAAQDSVNALLPDKDNPQPPDSDSLQAAQNTLSSSLSAMPGTLNGISASTQNTVNGLVTDLQAVSKQLNAMNRTINSASEHLGVSITDVSDQDTAEDLTGKVEHCINTGSLLADLNAGGIAGAMAMENDLDLLEDWQVSGEESLNVQSMVRAVLLNCRNEGIVTAKKQNAGGIAGWQALGLIRDCANTGPLQAETADYVGGIAGLSSGYLRRNHTKCTLWGGSGVGGIAGSAAIVTDCRSTVLLHNSGEQAGAVLGVRSEPHTDEKEPILGNYYLNFSVDPGGIDGISYAGLAQPLPMEEFLALDALPELFDTVTVRFVYEDGTETTLTLVPGGALSDAAIPSLPEKEGYAAEWAGLQETDRHCIWFDQTFTAQYTALRTVIQSLQTRENGLPLLLAEGSFTNAGALSAEPSVVYPALTGGKTPVEAWALQFTEPDRAAALRYLLPTDADPQQLTLHVGTAAGGWRKADFTVDGSYLVLSLQGDETQLALLHTAAQPQLWLAGGLAGGSLITLVLTVLLRRRGIRNAAPATE